MYSLNPYVLLWRAKIIIQVPTKPTITPIILFRVNEIEKTKAPTIMANNGVVEFKMPIIALLILVPATQKQTAGIRLPNNPKSGIYLILDVSIRNDFLLIMKNGVKLIKAIPILNDAT